jgi:hypothetical protein
MTPPPTGIIDSDDPWIAGYLKLRHAVLTGKLDTQEEIATYATELRRGLPDPTPPPSIAATTTALRPPGPQRTPRAPPVERLPRASLPTAGRSQLLSFRREPL